MVCSIDGAAVLQVTASKGWAGLARTFGSGPSMTSASFLIKRIYERYLAPYEQVGPGPVAVIMTPTHLSCLPSHDATLSGTAAASRGRPGPTSAIR